MCKLHTPLPRMGCNYTSEDYVVGPCGLSLVPMSQRGITRCRVGWTSHTESKGDMAPDSSATVREAASALHVPDADAAVVDKYHGADEPAAGLCTAVHHNPAAAGAAAAAARAAMHSTVARAAAGAAKSGYAAPPVGVNVRLHCLSGS